MSKQSDMQAPHLPGTLPEQSEEEQSKLISENNEQVIEDKVRSFIMKHHKQSPALGNKSARKNSDDQESMVLLKLISTFVIVLLVVGFLYFFLQFAQHRRSQILRKQNAYNSQIIEDLDRVVEQERKISEEQLLQQMVQSSPTVFESENDTKQPWQQAADIAYINPDFAPTSEPLTKELPNLDATVVVEPILVKELLDDVNSDIPVLMQNFELPSTDFYTDNSAEQKGVYSMPLLQNMIEDAIEDDVKLAVENFQSLSDIFLNPLEKTTLVEEMKPINHSDLMSDFTNIFGIDKDTTDGGLYGVVLSTSEYDNNNNDSNSINSSIAQYNLIDHPELDLSADLADIDPDALIVPTDLEKEELEREYQETLRNMQEMREKFDQQQKKIEQEPKNKKKKPVKIDYNRNNKKHGNSNKKQSVD